jgi:glycosyltransferase involved in cell wall biosynthesis
VKALVIAPQPFFSPRGTPLSVYYRTLVMSELGVEIDLLTYGQGQDVALPGVRVVRIPRFQIFGPVKVGPSSLKLFLDFFILVWTLALLVRHRYHFVHAHEEAIFFCRFLKPVFRFKLIYDMHSSLPQQLKNFNFTESRLLVGLFERLEEQSLRAADAVITICPELARYAVPRVPDPERHLLIENSLFDEVRIRGGTAESEESAAAPLPEGRPVVLYAGTLESYQGISLLLEAFAAARERRADAFLLVVGGSSEQVAQYRAEAAARGLASDCLFTGRVSQARAKEYQAQAAVLTSPRSKGTNTPLKIYEQLASGIPLVATRILSHTQVLNEQVCFLVDPDPAAMAAGIVAALDDGERRQAVVAAARALYEQMYSRPVYTEKMRRLLELVS